MFSSLNGVHRGATAVVKQQAPVQEAQPINHRAAPQVVSEEEQLLGFLRNLTRADAAQVIALTQPQKGDTQQSYDSAARAYGEF